MGKSTEQKMSGAWKMSKHPSHCDSPVLRIPTRECVIPWCIGHRGVNFKSGYLREKSLKFKLALICHLLWGPGGVV